MMISMKLDIKKPRQFQRKTLDDFIKDFIVNSVPYPDVAMPDWLNYGGSRNLNNEMLSYNEYSGYGVPTLFVFVEFYHHINNYYNEFNPETIAEIIIRWFPNEVRELVIFYKANGVNDEYTRYFN